MPKIFYSSVIPASIDRIWAIIRDFKELPSWNPSFSDCSIEEGRPGDALGSVMSLHLKSGGHLRERLLAHSDRDHMCTYTIVESPLPITDYVATIQLLPVTDTNQTYAQWTSEFNCPPDVESDMINTVRGVYQAGFDFLKTHFTTQNATSHLDCIGGIDLDPLGDVGNQSQQFLYVQFKVTPKGTLTRVTGSQTVAIELPSKRVADWKLQRPGRYLTDEEIAIELTQGVAIGTADRFVVLSHDPLKQQEIHSARFLPERLPIMNERDCDNEDSGIRAWFIGPGELT